MGRNVRKRWFNLWNKDGIGNIKVLDKDLGVF